MPEKEACGDCKYYHGGENLGQGACRAFPPKVFLVPVQGGIGFSSRFPEVDSDKWCGQFKKK